MNADDPKFTAHALGELEDLTPAERAEIEALLASDPAAAAEAAETQALAARLRAELSVEAAAALQEEQRAAVLQAVGSTEPASKVVPFLRRANVFAALAACAVVGISIALIYQALQVPNVNSLRSTTVMEKTPEVGLVVADGTFTDPAAKAPSQMLATPAPVARSAQGGDVAAAISAGSLTASASAPSAMALGTAIQHVPAGAAVPDMLNDLVTKSMPVARPVTPDHEGFANEGKFRGSVRIGGRAQTFNRYTFTRRSATKALEEFNTRAFDAITENAFLTARENPLSTFSIDVDTASYAIVRRFLNDNQRPPGGAVRIEELLNYFTYDYPQPKGDVPFSATMEVAACPWAPEHRLVRIGLKGREIPKDQRPPSNLVFLIDVSGSMFMPNKLPLVKESLGLLIDQLRDQDQVAIVVYAGNTGCVLEPTHDRAKMREVLSRLEAGGSTNGASGIQLAYQLAEKSFIKGGTNRVILATDGDWNVGITNQSQLLEMIAQKAKGGVFLTALGFGMDNLNDSMLMKLADRGNGNYAYIDTLIEAKKVFVEQLSSTLVTIAKDVKIQVEFNPAQVGAYRLIGYEKRMLAKEDFNNDQKDAGEIGAGHTVTALYEVVPAGQEQPQIAMVDKLKYQPETITALPKDAPLSPEPAPSKAEEKAPASPAPAAPGSEPVAQAVVPPLPVITVPLPKALPTSVRNELLTLKLRYKAPDGDTSKLLEFPLTDPGTAWEKSSPDFRFAAAVAGYGMLLRDSNYRGQVTWSSVAEWAHEGLGPDVSGYRTEFLSLLEKAKALAQ
ncbi:MAG: von Willebrand factor type A domain-containing protein [Chthoniobacter sp.]|nr:von Willebrand factor type A domain-containing protein [Chthoniobacter sp.]